MNNGLLHGTNMVKYYLLGYRIDDGCDTELEKINIENLYYCHDVQKFSLVSFLFKKQEYFNLGTIK